MKRLYAEAGESTSSAELLGDHSFTIYLNDGYTLGENETQSTFVVTITPRPNNLPYFAQPGLKPQRFYCEDEFVYTLPQTADEDPLDTVSVTLDNSEAPWV